MVRIIIKISAFFVVIAFCFLLYWWMNSGSINFIVKRIYNIFWNHYLKRKRIANISEKNYGAIFFPVINLNPYPVTLEKGTVIGQGIISTFFITEDDNTTAIRTGGFGSTNE